MKATAVLSMLHEDAAHNSATRRFRSEPILSWTLRRLSVATALSNVVVLCWDDQVADITAAGGTPSPVGPRTSLPQVEAITAARRWADGWRGGLLNSTHFDLGFSAAHIERASSDDAVVLIDPSAGMIDPKLIDQLIEHAAHQSTEYAFLPAAPGFGAMLLRRPLLERLAKSNTTPGRLVTYQPDAPMRDPLGGDACAEVPVALSRSPRRFNLDSQHQIGLLESTWEQLNGELVATSAERLIALAGPPSVGTLPRDVTLELTTRRVTIPIFAPTSSHRFERSDLSIDHAIQLFAQLANRDDSRVTLAGVGDPVLHEHFFHIIAAARLAGIRAIHVETDLLPANLATIDELAASGVDVVSVHIPAMTAETYAAVMGVDRLGEVIENIKRFVAARARRGSGVPILAPTFVKTTQNLGEMEAWYDQWLRAVGTAVVIAPSTFAGAIVDVSVGNMAPPMRVPCRRIQSRMTVLCDGTVVSCEEDIFGRRPLGKVGETPIREIWGDQFGALRSAHADRQWSGCELCQKCQEWHRP